MISERLKSALHRRYEELERTAPITIAREERAFMLWGGPGGGHFITLDGVVLAYSDFDYEGLIEETTPKGRLIALKIGCEKIPELVELLPVRPADAVTCNECHGSGYRDLPQIPTNFIVCNVCSGMGWLAPAV